MSSGNRDRGRYQRNISQLPEVLLWNRVKQDQLGFYLRRQFLFDQYIFDLYCSELKLDIEIDGKIHELKKDQDEIRDAAVKSKGVRVLRIPARQILRDPDLVAQKLKDYMTRLREKNIQDTPQDDEK